MKNDCVIVENISYRYGKHQILNAVSLEARPGELVAIIGRNGCGKSTLMRILAGVMKPDQGKLLYFGQNPYEKKEAFYQICGYVPQEMPLIEELSVWDNIKLWGIAKEGYDEGVIDAFALREMYHQKVEKLSGGMKRRLTIALALMSHPRILLLDEPTTFLDIVYKNQIASYIDQYRKSGGIVIMTSHEEREILAADKRYFIHNGVMKDCTQEDDIRMCFEGFNSDTI